jgi:hypothetical protein
MEFRAKYTIFYEYLHDPDYSLQIKFVLHKTFSPIRLFFFSQFLTEDGNGRRFKKTSSFRSRHRFWNFKFWIRIFKD